MPNRSFTGAICASVLVVVAILLSSSSVTAQQATLPENWRQLSPTDLMTSVRELYDQGKFETLSKSDQDAVRARGKELFTAIDVASTELAYPTVEGLHWLAFPLLDGDNYVATRNAVLSRQDDWAGKSYLEMRSKFWLMERLGIEEAVCIAEARRWVDAGGTIDQVPTKDLTNEVVLQLFAPNGKLIKGDFAIRWEGLVNAPETGAYTFSISPINVNSKDPAFPVSVSMRIAIEGQEILNATPANWVERSTPVNLTNGSPAAIRVEMSADVEQFPPGTFHAQLYWEGPGVAKRIVQMERLSHPMNSGLLATYTWTENDQQQTLSRKDAEIDFAWTNNAIFLAADKAVPQAAADTVWEQVSTDEYMTWCEGAGGAVKWHPYFREMRGAPASMSSGRRRAFLEKLLAHPALLDVLSPKDAVNLYQCFRFGATDEALRVFGKWAQQQADWQPSMSTDPIFEGENRDWFRKMGICVTQELPTEVARLQSDYLELPDGRCCLPVAYSLAYSYLGRGKLDDWIAVLSARLNDQSVTGDKRVNWLLARAHAEELRDSQADPYAVPTIRVLNGRGYLDEGLLVFETSPVKVRIAKEIAARLVSTQQLSAAKSFLEQTANSLPEADRAQVLIWHQEIEAMEGALAQSQQAEAAATQDAYLKNLRKRRERANASGDTAAVERYDALINAAGGR